MREKTTHIFFWKISRCYGHHNWPSFKLAGWFYFPLDSSTAFHSRCEAIHSNCYMLRIILIFWAAFLFYSAFFHAQVVRSTDSFVHKRCHFVMHIKYFSFLLILWNSILCHVCRISLSVFLLLETFCKYWQWLDKEAFSVICGRF